MAALAAGSVLAVMAIQFTPTAAQPVKHIVLEKAQAVHSGECITLTVSFNLPVQYLRNAPRGRGLSLYMDVRPLATGTATEEGLAQREAVRVQSDGPIPIIAVVYDGTLSEPRIAVDFDMPMVFSVQQGADFRSLVVRAAPPASAAACAIGP
jgi:hypothetical protein